MAQDYATNFSDLPASLKPVDVAKALNISKAQAYNLINSEGFPHIRVGARYVIPKNHFIAWVNANMPENPKMQQKSNNTNLELHQQLIKQMSMQQELLQQLLLAQQSMQRILCEQMN